jgi:hypothetical protein
MEKPNGLIKCKVIWFAAQRRAIFPVLPGISGSYNTISN